MAKKKKGASYANTSAAKPSFGKYVKNVQGSAAMGKKKGGKKKKSSGY